MGFSRRPISAEVVAFGLVLVLAGCGSSSDGNGTGAGGSLAGGSGGTRGQGGATASGSGGRTGAGAGGQAGSTTSAGGATGQGGQAGRNNDGGSPNGGATGSDGGVTSSCVGKAWGTADPSNPGPFHVVTETNVGPLAGQPDPKYNNTVQRFNIYRPMEMATSGYCHPVVMWSNGHGDQPSTYEVLLKQLVTHGFVVMASLSSIPSQGTPIPVIAGMDWIIQQNDDPTSEFYHHLDTAHIGATGHSEGGFATCLASSDPHVKAVASIAGSRANAGRLGPALLLCGDMDTQATCPGIISAYTAMTAQTVPIMLGENPDNTHGSWIGSIKNPYMIAVTGWMRVHLMSDIANRSMFYGPSCTLCTDARNWKVMRSMIDQ